jgi:hypothetical protein
VVYGDECLLVLDKRFDLASRKMKLVEELRALLGDESSVAGRKTVDGSAKELVV